MLSAAIPQLPMFDLEATEKFYVEKLGFKIVGKMTQLQYLNMKRDNAMIHFLGYEENVARNMGSFTSVYIYPKDVDKLASEFRNAGVKFRYGPEKMPWGMYEFQIDDPCGNAIRFGSQI